MSCILRLCHSFTERSEPLRLPAGRTASFSARFPTTIALLGDSLHVHVISRSKTDPLHGAGATPRPATLHSESAPADSEPLAACGDTQMGLVVLGRRIPREDGFALANHGKPNVENIDMLFVRWAQHQVLICFNHSASFCMILPHYVVKQQLRC